TSSPKPRAHVGCVIARWISRSRRFFSSIGRIRAGDPMLGTLPGYPQPAERQPTGFVADQSWREALGETALGRQLQGPQAGRLAERAGTLRQQRPEGLAGASVEDRGGGVWSCRWRLQHR